MDSLSWKDMRYERTRITTILFVLFSVHSMAVGKLISAYDQKSYRMTENTESKQRLTNDHYSSSTSCRVQSSDVQCMPPFRNIAQGVSVTASTNCGLERAQRLCRSDGTCQLCESRSVQNSFSPKYLTDLHDPQNQTCWASDLVLAGGGPTQTVNLTLSLGKRFEVYYISLQPCSIGSLPDSIAIYKSSDFGHTWRPWHFFSIDCFRAFGLPTTDEYNSHITTANLQEVLCVALQPNEGYFRNQMRRRRSMHFHSQSGSSRHFTTSDWVIAFSTTLGRPAQRPWSPALIDWMTMTDIRISMMRFPPSLDYKVNGRRIRTTPTGFNAYENVPNWFLRSNSLVHTSQARRSVYAIPSNRYVRQADNLSFDRVANITPKLDFAVQDLLVGNPATLAESEFYAFADLTIGGRCKCNGHASDCFFGPDGKLKCACEHNTEGDDCERCKPGYMDRPWETATAQEANSCTKCECNLHSNNCRFSNSLYLMSNRVSGGICENCQHNTAGRHCQHCAEGFYRDWTKPISHERVCLPCRCHPIGSLIRHMCDRRSGQCRCKQGVTGLKCDRCQDQYHQTRSPTNPCTKDIPQQVMALAHIPKDVHCSPCNAKKVRMRLKKFCRKDAVFQANFKSRELHGTMVRYEMHITRIWRLSQQHKADQQPIYWSIHSVMQSDKFGELESAGSKSIPVWIHLNELRCKCPDIELGITYLIVTDFQSYEHKGRVELRFTPKTAVLPWRPSWDRRLTRFRRKQERGACDRYLDTEKLRAHPRKSMPNGWYTRVLAPAAMVSRLQNNHVLPTALPSYRLYSSPHKPGWYNP